jgi:PAS domain S-box-containing protein
MELSERLYRTLIENCRDGVFLIQHGVIIFCNEALARALGYTAAELTGADYAQHVASDDRVAQLARRSARESGSMDTQSYEIHLVHRDGSIRLFEVSAGAVMYRGEPASIGTMRDITDAHAQQQRVAEAEERYRLALWGSGDELFDWDLVKGTLVPVTSELRGAAGAAVAMPTVEGLRQFVHEDDLPAYVQAIADHLEGKTPHFEGSYRLRSKSGGWKWKLARGMVVARDADGRPTRLIGTQKDITKLKLAEQQLLDLTQELDSRVRQRTRELEEEGVRLQATNIQLTNAIDELRKMQSELIEAEKMASLGRLVAGVAHEVNTPLGVGMTAVSFLRSQLASAKAALAKSVPPERVEQLLAPLDSAAAMAETNMQRAANLIKSFKQVAVDQSTSTIRTIAVREYLDGILQSLHPALKKTRHKVVVECDPLVAVRSRPDALYQVISNLVMNSLTHAFPDGRDGTIRIAATLHERHLEIVYADDGIGMEPAVASRVFEPFFTTRRDHGGTGLGMHIAYNLVTQALGGRISCASTPGHGVRFEIVFPRELAKTEAPTEVPA